MAGGTDEADHDTAMLQPAVGIEQPGPDRPDVRAQGVSRHDVEPTVPASLDVIVEEKKDLPAGGPGRIVVELRPIEGSRVRDDPDVASPLEIFKECENLE